jgi:hypothetical protein
MGPAKVEAVTACLVITLGEEVVFRASFHAAAILNRTLGFLESGRRPGGEITPEEKEEFRSDLEYLLELLGYLS